MAIVKLKDVEVVALNQTGNGVKLLESNEYQGKTYSQKFTAWFKEPSGLNVGDVVSVSGFLGVKAAEFQDEQTGETKHYAEVSINSPRIENSQFAPAPQRQAAPPVAPAKWSDPDDAPF